MHWSACGKSTWKAIKRSSLMRRVHGSEKFSVAAIFFRHCLSRDKTRWSFDEIPGNCCPEPFFDESSLLNVVTVVVGSSQNQFVSGFGDAKPKIVYRVVWPRYDDSMICGAALLGGAVPSGPCFEGRHLRADTMDCNAGLANVLRADPDE